MFLFYGSENYKISFVNNCEMTIALQLCGSKNELNTVSYFSLSTFLNLDRTLESREYFQHIECQIISLKCLCIRGDSFDI